MRFVVDECAGPGLAAWLKEAGHEVFSIYDEMRGCSDDDVMAVAEREESIIVTLDKDFGEKVFQWGQGHHGVVLLRLQDQRTAVKIEVMKRLLESHGSTLPGGFVVVSEERVRVARVVRHLFRR